MVLLVVPLLVGTRALLRPGQALARRHTMLATPIVGLLGAILFSAVMRMKLYVQYFGLTTDRFYPLIFMAWLGIVLAWLAVTVLRGRGRLFIAGVATSGLAVLGALNVVSPDAVVARFNLERAAHLASNAEARLDLRSMANLSADAVDITVQAVLSSSSDREAECASATTLLNRWGPDSMAAFKSSLAGAWRWHNAAELHAFHVVSTNAARLDELARRTCAAR
ncbi:MAG: hypothetical protein JWM95_815 [Gemmatimonadetes bacterium]|nr:hypothetical protein [Gemmatimonadota bacterium]